MQHTAFKQAETLLKRSLKGKVTITRALVIGFLMTGLVSVGGQVVLADSVAAPTTTVDAENNVLNATYGGESIGLGTNASVHKNDIVLGINAKSANSLVAGNGATAEQTVSRNVAVGYGANVDAVKSVVIGNEASIKPPAGSTGLQEAVAIGSRATVTSTFSTAIGTGTTVSGAQSTAIGFGSTSSGNQSTSMGINAAASGASSMALGAQAKASGAGATAIAPTANAQGENSLAIGYSAVTTATSERSVVVGPTAKADGPRAIAVGNGAYALANRSLAVGNVAEVKSTYGVAVGAGATVDKGESNVALGTQSKDKATVQVADATVTATDGGTFTYGAATGYNFAGTASAVVSVGDAGKERQIVNVAPGAINATSTDAINGSQLYAVAQRVERGWDIAGDNGTTVTYVNPAKKVSFKNGDLTTATVEADGSGNPSVKYDVTTATPTVNTTADAANMGAVTAPSTNGVVTANDLTSVLTNGGWNTNAIGSNITSGADTNRAVIGFGKSVDFAAGKNMEVNREVKDGNVTYTYATKDDVEFNKVTVGGIVIGDQTTNDVNGGQETGNFISGLENKQWDPDNITSGRAATEDQLKSVSDAVTQGWDIAGNDGKKVTGVTPGKTVSFKNGNLTTATVEADGSGNPSVKYDVTTAAPTVNTTAGDANMGAVTKPTTNGVVTAEDLTNVLSNGGWNTNATGDNIATNANKDRKVIGFGKSVDFAAGKNMEVDRTVDGDGNVTYTYATKKDVQFDKVTVGGTENPDGTYTDGIVIGKQDTTNEDGDTETGKFVSGLDNKTWDQDNITSGRAATEDQLQQAIDNISNGTTPGATGGFGLKDSDGNTVTQDLGKQISIIGNEKTADGETVTNVKTTVGKDANGNPALKIDLSNEINLNEGDTKNGSITAGDTTINKDGIDTNKVTVGADDQGKGGIVIGNQTVTNAQGNPETGNYITGLGNTTWDPNNIVSGRAATEDQLKDLDTKIDKTAKGTRTLVTVNEQSVAPGSDAYGDTVTSGSLTVKAKEDSKTGQLTYDFKLANSVVLGEKGKDGKDGEAGSIIVNNEKGQETIGINGKDGTIGINGKDGSSATLGVEKGDPGVNGKDGDTMDRIKYLDSNGDPHQVATLDDGVKYAGDFGDGAAIKLNKTATIVGNAKSEADLVDGNIGVVASQDGDNAKLTVKLNKDLNLSKEGSITAGNTTINKDGIDTNKVTVGADDQGKGGIVIGNQNVTNAQGGTETGNYITGLDNKKWDPNNIVSGRAATEDQLQQLDSKITDVAQGTRTKVTVNEQSVEAGKDAYGNTVTSGSLAVKAKEDSKTGQLTYDFKLANSVVLGEKGKDGKDGEAGSIIVNNEKGQETIGINGKDGSITVKDSDGKQTIGINGQDGTIGINGKDGSSATLGVEKGDPGVNGKDGDTMDRIKYVDSNGNPHQVATMDDGVKYAGDFGDGAAIKLNKTATIVGNAKSESDLVDGNIGVVASQDGDNAKLTVKLNKNLNLSETGSVTMGNTVINNDGLTINNSTNPANNVVINGDKISMGGNRIENVGTGVADTDAVNVKQLRDEIGGAVNPLREEVYDVGASAAALGALKPLQYDPLEPTQIMVGYGNYRGSSALAMGVAHYKNESTMFHAGMSWAGGSSHMMANAGITWKVGSRDSETAVADRYRKGPISSAYAMQNEMAAMKAQNAGLKGEVADLKAENEQMKAQIAAMMAKLGL
ncbi:YadA-like family protein [Veillonella caviae]|uniref:YadA-like family protein n=2 Tax=Veillonella caviae TaxID=248316 RepID=UPI002A920573|nr:YadA-like family protein [Veillonella caviae]MDY6225463.1 YadA-like family protein [Veillonella caviae]